MNATQLNKWSGGKRHGTNPSPLIRQLQTGTMPSGQGSVNAPINDAPTDYIFQNSVPFVDFPQHVAPPGTPGRQNLRVAPTAQTPPWISVPLCAQGRRIGRPSGIGKTGSGSGSVLNLPSKSSPKFFTAFQAGG